jgi:hypothetical protein
MHDYDYVYIPCPGLRSFTGGAFVLLSFYTTLPRVGVLGIRYGLGIRDFGDGRPIDFGISLEFWVKALGGALHPFSCLIRNLLLAAGAGAGSEHSWPGGLGTDIRRGFEERQTMRSMNGSVHFRIGRMVP